MQAMIPKIKDIFLWSAAVILFVKALAELSGTLSPAPFLDEPDPFLLISSRLVLVLLGVCELVLSAYLLMGKNLQIKLWLTAWFATNLMVYRIGLQSQGAPDFSDCLGNFDDWLPVTPRILHVVMEILLIFLLAGSYGSLLLNWLAHRKPSKAISIMPDALVKST